jgi:hypothetical protein
VRNVTEKPALGSQLSFLATLHPVFAQRSTVNTMFLFSPLNHWIRAKYSWRQDTKTSIPVTLTLLLLAKAKPSSLSKMWSVDLLKFGRSTTIFTSARTELKVGGWFLKQKSWTPHQITLLHFPFLFTSVDFLLFFADTIGPQQISRTKSFETSAAAIASSSAIQRATSSKIKPAQSNIPSSACRLLLTCECKYRNSSPSVVTRNRMLKP